ncbi:hypothetical protein FO519_007494 [Halicephalobus sp. NKZ332]|nr:hypothetical protein FO519_007494 [Halicephalobus sp. NKZ332]
MMAEQYQQEERCHFMNTCLSMLSQTGESDDEDYYGGPSLQALRKQYEEKAEKAGRPFGELEPDDPIPSRFALQEKPYISNPSPDDIIQKPDHLPKEYDDYKFSEKLPFTQDQLDFLTKSKETFQTIGDINKERFQEVVGDDAKKSMFHPDNRTSGPFWIDPPSGPDPS